MTLIDMLMPVRIFEGAHIYLGLAEQLSKITLLLCGTESPATAQQRSQLCPGQSSALWNADIYCCWHTSWHGHRSVSRTSC